MDAVSAPFWLFLAGPLAGLALARLFDRLTWPRALVASAWAKQREAR